MNLTKLTYYYGDEKILSPPRFQHCGVDSSSPVVLAVATLLLKLAVIVQS